MNTFSKQSNNSGTQDKQINSRHVLLSAMLGLLLATPAAILAAPLPHTYPAAQEMRKIYDQIHASEVQDPSLYIENPSIALLRSVYDYGVESGTVDLVSQTYKGPAEVADLNIKNANDYVVSEAGEVVGYLDEQSRHFDLNGKNIAQSKATSYTVNYFLIYSGANFTGTGSGRATYSGSTSTATVTPAFGGIWSIIVSPNVRIKVIFKNGGYATYSGGTSGYYYANFRSAAGDVSKIEVLSAPVTTISQRCGTLYKDINYGGDALPFYDEGKLVLSSVGTGWANTVSSVAVSTGTGCENFAALENDTIEEDLNQRRLRWSPTAQFPNLSTYTPNMDNTIELVETHGDATNIIRLADGRRLTEDQLGSLVNDVQEEYQFTPTYGCNFAAEVCTTPVGSVANLAAGVGYGFCAKAFGPALLASIGTAALTVAGPATAGLSEAAAAQLAPYAWTEIMKGIGCMSAVWVAKSAVGAACTTAETNWCMEKINQN